MEIIDPSIEFLWQTENALKTIECAARTCYKSEHAICDGSAERLVKILVKHGHTAMLEHAVVSYRVTCDRGVSHEIVRHRIASYAQESTRYVNYQKHGIKFIRPSTFDINSDLYNTWKQAMASAELKYNMMLDAGAKPQEARAVLPNSTKTEIVMTLNLRSWLNFFKLRCAKDAHPDIRVIADMIKNDLKEKIPVLFNET